MKKINCAALQKLVDRQKKSDSLLCVGLDSDMAKIPERFLKMKQPQFSFNTWIIDQTHQFAAAYKPNMAFYEARGDQGITELKLTLDYLQERHPEIMTICDAKRADIGSTNLGYVTSYFDWFGFDAVTLNPYLGREAIEPFLARSDKACIILCRTSNPGSGELQDLVVGPDKVPLWQVVAQKVATDWNANQNCMLVVGATYPEEMAQIRQVSGDMPFLVPGVGEQGGDLRAVLRAGLTKNQEGLLINASRSIIFAADPAAAAKTMVDQIRAEVSLLGAVQ